MPEHAHLPVEHIVSICNGPEHIARSDSSENAPKLAITISRHKEAATILSVLNKVIDLKLTNGIEKEIIIVNDNSTDDTPLIICNYISSQATPQIHYLQHDTNKGKRTAIRTGIHTAKGHADVVYGSIFTGGNPHRILSFWYSIRIYLAGISYFGKSYQKGKKINLKDAFRGIYSLVKHRFFSVVALKEKKYLLSGTI